MEVGAVKQAFNNEVIHLKQKLNQARIQVIHKLTRKAKTLVEKKAPEKIQEKLKRKAESAVKEVLILKKVKPKDLARFAVTHKGDLKSCMNRPNVDMDKACARLLLHKALQDKYIHMRKMYSNVPIEDLLMTRLERRKLKKDEREKKKKKREEKNKKRAKTNSISSEGDWTVEDVKGDGGKKQSKEDDTNLSDESKLSDDERDSEGSDNEEINDKSIVKNKFDESEQSSDDEEINDASKVIDKVNESEEESDDDPQKGVEKDDQSDVSEKENSESSDVADNVDEENNYSSKEKNYQNLISPKHNTKMEKNCDGEELEAKEELIKKPIKEDNRKKLPRINKEKNKKQLEKLTSKKFKKGIDEVVPQDNKVVDPFFITATGGNYMSVAEPRGHDEVKAVHRQGNRKHRRAVMFGKDTRPRPYNNWKANGNNDAGFRNSFDNSESNNGFNKFRDGKFKRNERSFEQHDNDSKMLGQQNGSSNFGGGNKNKSFDRHSSKHNDFSKNNDFGNKDEKSKVPEKLHPSWEAKKKISTILPFQGKKIKFDEG